MTIQEAIAKIDDLKPNQYTNPNKISWISNVDGRAWKEVISKYKHDEEYEWHPFDESTDLSMELLIDEPYAELYIYYLAAMIDFWNGEFTRYNNDLQMFEALWQSFADDYAKTHSSDGATKFRL